VKTDTTPEHSRLSPSKAHTWTECTAALAFVKANEHRLPPDKPGPSAMEGTKAHTVAEKLLLGEELPKWALANTKEAKAMRTFGKAYAEFCHDVMGPKREVIRWGAEFRAPLYYLPSERGTVDFHALTKNGAHLVDYKYGYDPVESENNLQMAIYARSLIENMFDGFWMALPADDYPVTMTIFQPRLEQDHVTWTTTWGELKKFTDERITPKAAAILRGDPGVFKCGPKICKWCRATAICETHNDAMLEDFKDEVLEVLEGNELLPVTTVPDEQLVKFFINRDKLLDRIKEVEKFVTGRMLSGKKLPGVKLVLSRGGHRRWTDPAEAGELLLSCGLPHDEVYPPSDVITPAVAEKLTDKMKGPKMIEMQRLIIKPPGSPMAVPESDPRKAYENDMTSDFAGVDLEEE